MCIRDRIRRKHTMPREYAHDSALTVCQVKRPSLIETLVKLSVKISSRFSNIKELEKRFGFLCIFEACINDGDIHFKEQLSLQPVSYTHLLFPLNPYFKISCGSLFSSILPIRSTHYNLHSSPLGFIENGKSLTEVNYSGNQPPMK